MVEPANSAHGRALSTALAPRDVSIDYLRATITLLVVAHHSSLAYTTFARFHPDAYLASTHPVVDPARWKFLDYAENFNDVFFMSLMFCVSGLFVWPSLRRSGVLSFVNERARRLGIPFVVGITFLMPLAYYASWLLTGRSAGYVSYWKQFLVSDGRPSGPLWFIWVLLLFDLLAAFAYGCFRNRGHASGQTARRPYGPVSLAALMIVVGGAVYLPALATFGFGAWRAFVTGPFYFQTARLGLYLAWFAFGIFLGRSGISQGVLAKDSALARRWPLWIVCSFVAYNALEFIPRALSSEYQGAFEALLWVVSCVLSCFACLAVFRGLISTRRRWMDSLTRCAYGIYLVHYVFVLWTQRMLMNFPMHAGLKFLATFIVATVASWIAVQLLLRIPALRDVL